MAHGILTPCNVACGSGIMTVNSPSGSTLQCDTWLWDDMPLNSPKRPPCWNSKSGFDFDLITAVDMSFCTSLRNFIEIGPPSAEKMTSCRYSRWWISAILDFRDPIIGFLKAQLQLTKLLSFPENRVFAFWRQHPRWRISPTATDSLPVFPEVSSLDCSQFFGLLLDLCSGYLGGHQCLTSCVTHSTG